MSIANRAHKTFARFWTGALDVGTGQARGSESTWLEDIAEFCQTGVEEACSTGVFRMANPILALSIGAIATLVQVLALLYVVLKRRYQNARIRRSKSCCRVAFLHPECLNGGGGERVLWVAVKAVRSALPEAELAVCAPWSPANSSADSVRQAQERVSAQFNLQIPDFTPVRVSLANITRPTNFPRLTLVLQAIAACILGAEAFAASYPDVLIDTANQTFSLVPARVLGAVTVSYIHYPTISTDMLDVVGNRVQQFNNSPLISNSRVLTFAKQTYYRLFAKIYAVAGRASDITMVNSSWTYQHIAKIWDARADVRPDKLKRSLHPGSGSSPDFRLASRPLSIVFPPCDTPLLRMLPLSSPKRSRRCILSVGQFRPEKNHMLQLEAMHKLTTRLNHEHGRVKLVMVGGERNSADRDRVAGLKRARREMGLDSSVEIRTNIEWNELLELLSQAWVGIHTMRDEHFGISVVELQSAGVIAVGHRSGGVAMDLIKDGETGFLADTADEYAEKLHRAIVAMSEDDIESMRIAARTAADRFSDAAFGGQFATAVRDAVDKAGNSHPCNIQNAHEA